MSREDREKLGKGINAFTFGAMGRYIKLHAYDISESFNQSAKGSSRNFFVRVNFNAFKEALGLLFASSGGDLMTVTDEQIVSAVESFATENPQRIFRVYRTGYPKIYLRGSWSTSDNPNKKPKVNYVVLENMSINAGTNVHVAPMQFSANESLDIELWGSFVDFYEGDFKISLNDGAKTYDLEETGNASVTRSFMTKIIEDIEVSQFAISVHAADGTQTTIFQASLNGSDEEGGGGDDGDGPGFD